MKVFVQNIDSTQRFRRVISKILHENNIDHTWVNDNRVQLNYVQWGRPLGGFYINIRYEKGDSSIRMSSNLNLITWAIIALIILAMLMSIGQASPLPIYILGNIFLFVITSMYFFNKGRIQREIMDEIIAKTIH